MASEQEQALLCAELSKLQKQELIEMLITHKVPVTVANVQLIKFIDTIRKTCSENWVNHVVVNQDVEE